MADKLYDGLEPEAYVRKYAIDVVQYVNGTVMLAPARRSVFYSWDHAAQFIEKTRNEIAQVREEIDWLEGFSAYAEHSIYGPARQRILARQQAALADLQRGMKEASDAGQ